MKTFKRIDENIFKLVEVKNIRLKSYKLYGKMTGMGNIFNWMMMDVLYM
jgi:hypothetical protein